MMMMRYVVPATMTEKLAVVVTATEAEDFVTSSTDMNEAVRSSSNIQYYMKASNDEGLVTTIGINVIEDWTGSNTSSQW